MILAFFFTAGILKYFFLCDLKAKSLKQFELLIKLYENVTFMNCDLDMNGYKTYDLNKNALKLNKK